MPVRRLVVGESSVNDNLQSSSVSVSSSQRPVDINDVDKALRQLICKRSLQDEDSQVDPAASVYTSVEVAKLVRLICGENKSKLKVGAGQPQDIENVVKQVIKETKVGGGEIIVKEGFAELFHNAETIVFQNVLGNGPEDWVRLVLPIIVENLKKEILKTELDKEVNDINLKRRENAKDYSLDKKQLGKLQEARKCAEGKTSQDNLQRVRLALKVKTDEIAKIKDAREKSGPKVSNSEVDSLLQKFAALKDRRSEAKSELASVSINETLPPTIHDALVALEGRKSYLSSLLERIENPIDSSMNDSVFSSRKSHC